MTHNEKNNELKNTLNEETGLDLRKEVELEVDGDVNGVAGVYTYEDGDLLVEGTVFVGSIQERKKKVNSVNGSKKSSGTSNVVRPVGYKIKNVRTGQSKFIEKLEAIGLAMEYGVINATIRPREMSHKDEVGNIIKTDINLNLHPAKHKNAQGEIVIERPFTDGDRLYPVFKLDRNGKIIKPAELADYMTPENCTKTLWEIVERETKKRRPRGTKTYQKMERSEYDRRIKQALDAANFTKPENPFK